MNEPVIEARDVWKSYDNGRLTVLKGVSLAVSPGEIVALWGASGSGKSTLLHLLGALDIPDRGSLGVCGLDPTLAHTRLELRRHKVGFVFQLHNLLPDLNVLENVQIPGLACGVSAKEAMERAGQLAVEVGLKDRLRHRIQDLSGGERQRVAICRALFMRPRVLLADEPTGALDEKTGELVFRMLCEVARREKAAVLIATHERRFAEACDRMLRMRDGMLENS